MKEAGAEATAGFGAEGEGHEWELGIGSLIIDLDADIEKTGSGDGLRMKIKRKNGGKVKHEVVMSSSTSNKKTVTVGTMTEPELFGPCEPGTSVTLDGVVWQETDGGVLVVNVTWREKSYVGTLLDCTRHDWAPPRLCDDTNAMDNPDNPKQRQTGKRSLKVRPKSAARRTANSGFAVPPSPGKQPAAASAASASGSSQSSRQPALIMCPEPNCNKKYKHINGLKYHQTHAHSDRQSAAAVSTAAQPEQQATSQTVQDEQQSTDQSDSMDQQQLPLTAEPAEQMQTDETPADTQPSLPAQPCPSSPAYSDISDANEESEEPGAESPDDLPADSVPAAAAVPAPAPVSVVATSATVDTKPFSSFAFCSNFRSRDDRPPDGTADPQPQSAAALSFPYPYSYPAAFSLPASPGNGQNGEDGVCPTMETTGPPPAPTSSYFLHPLSFPHYDPMFRMFPDKGPGPPPQSSQPTAAPPGPSVPVASVAQETADGGSGGTGSRSPPTQRHLHTHHHTHVGVPFPPYHPISFPILSNPGPRATK